ncbi:MAG: SDR family oxidoreductase [Vicinamibacteraceae bacterium]|nr:SDR family oxidoreductase [Vicinamibacteraceae bacterium]
MQSRTALEGRFAGKVAIVTGGASGIGRATVVELCREGAAVAFTDLSPAGEALAADLSRQGHRAAFFQGDMADETFCRATIESVATMFARIDYLVNNAFSFLNRWADAQREDWHRVFDVGPVAYALMGALVTPHMERTGGGAVVNVSSISAFIAQPKRWTYNAAKGAVHTLTKCMALDLAPAGIRVNSVSPGWIWTPEVDKAAGGDRARWDPVWGQFHMLERCGNPVEVAAGILFLLSDDASFVTATDLAIDGGYQGLGSEGLGKASAFAGTK